MIEKFALAAGAAVRRVDELEGQVRDTEAELRQLQASRSAIETRISAEREAAPKSDPDHDEIAAELIADPAKLSDPALRERAREAAEREADAASAWADGIASLERAVEMAGAKIEAKDGELRQLRHELELALNERRAALRLVLLARYDVIARQGAELLGVLDLIRCGHDVRDEALHGVSFTADDRTGDVRDARLSLWPIGAYADRGPIEGALNVLLNELRGIGKPGRRAAA